MVLFTNAKQAWPLHSRIATRPGKRGTQYLRIEIRKVIDIKALKRVLGMPEYNKIMWE